MTPANPVTMIDPQGVPRQVPADGVSQAPADWKPATKMTDPQGTPRWIPTEAVSQARQANYAVHPDNPGVSKMVTPQGQVNYALPNEVNSFKQSGQTLINPDGSFDLQNIPGEDPLKEAERYQLVRKALTAEEKAGANRAELKNAAKAGAGAAVATAAGVTGAGPAAGAVESLIAPTVVPVAGGTGFGGAGATTTLGPSVASQAATWAARQLMKPAVKYAIGTAVGTGVGGGIVTKLMHLW